MSGYESEEVNEAKKPTRRQPCAKKPTTTKSAWNDYVFPALTNNEPKPGRKRSIKSRTPPASPVEATEFKQTLSRESFSTNKTLTSSNVNDLPPLTLPPLDDKPTMKITEQKTTDNTTTESKPLDKLKDEPDWTPPKFPDISTDFKWNSTAFPSFSTSSAGSLSLPHINSPLAASFPYQFSTTKNTILTGSDTKVIKLDERIPSPKKPQFQFNIDRTKTALSLLTQSVDAAMQLVPDNVSKSDLSKLLSLTECLHNYVSQLSIDKTCQDYRSRFEQQKEVITAKPNLFYIRIANGMFGCLITLTLLWIIYMIYYPGQNSA